MHIARSATGAYIRQNLFGGFEKSPLVLQQFNTQLFMDCTEMPDTLSFMIVSTGKLLIKNFNNLFAKLSTDVTFDQMGVLYYIWRHKGQKIIQQDIAEIMDKTKSAILRSIDILEEKGYVKRMPDPKDRRNNLLEITNAGMSIVEEIHEIFLKLEKDLLKGISKADRTMCLSVLSRIQEKYR